jgi:SAM-dependent methyltransferase
MTNARVTYSDEFFEKLEGGALRSARVIVPMILELVEPTSVVDVGCGTGAWLSVVRGHGVADVLGIDGDYVDRARLLIPEDAFLAADLSRPPKLDRRFDLVLSLEVAEHLPPSGAAHFVRFLCSLGDTVLFSAAVPGQGGTNHLNEQPQDYWAGLFTQSGFEPIDCFRDRLWDRKDVDWWYIQNTIMYCRTGGALERVRAEALPHPVSVSLNRVHPKLKEIREWRRQTSELYETLKEDAGRMTAVAVAGLHEINLGAIPGLDVLPFIERGGVFWGMPASSDEAITEVLRIQQMGVDAIAFAWNSWWLFTTYPALREHLSSSYRGIRKNDVVEMWDLK